MVFDEETGAALNEFIEEIDTIFYGRISYERWGNYQPSVESEQGEKDFYERTGRMKKYVFSKSAQKLEGNAEIISSDIVSRVESLKNETGKNIWLYGGAQLISHFVNNLLIDEYRIAVIPIILAKGKPMFSDINEQVHLQLVRTNTSSSGVVELVYRPADRK